MHSLLLHLYRATSPSTTVAKKSKSSSSYQLLIVLALLAVAYIAFLRPRTKRLRQQQVAARQTSVGDEVVTAGGIYGTVVAVDSDVVEVEVSPGIVLSMLPRAVSLRPGAPTTTATAGAAAGGADDDEWFAPGEGDESPGDTDYEGGAARGGASDEPGDPAGTADGPAT